jgi:hypothetical protein
MTLPSIWHIRRANLPKIEVAIDDVHAASIREIAERGDIREDEIAATKTLPEPGGLRTRRQGHHPERRVFQPQIIVGTDDEDLVCVYCLDQGRIGVDRSAQGRDLLAERPLLEP